MSHAALPATFSVAVLYLLVETQSAHPYTQLETSSDCLWLSSADSGSGFLLSVTREIETACNLW